MDTSRALQRLRMILLAVIVAVAVLSISWFIYGHFFITKNSAPVYTTSREAVVGTIRETSVPVPPVVRGQVLNSILSGAPTPQPDKNGEIQNTTPVAERQAVLQRMFGH